VRAVASTCLWTWLVASGLVASRLLLGRILLAIASTLLRVINALAIKVFRLFDALQEVNNLGWSQGERIEPLAVHLSRPALGGPVAQDVDDLVIQQVLVSTEWWKSKKLILVHLDLVLVVGTHLHVGWLATFLMQVTLDHDKNLVGDRAVRVSCLA
jgi:hypothetical protein